MGSSVDAGVVYDVILDDEPSQLIRDRAQSEGQSVEEWSAYEIAEWLGLDAYNGGDDEIQYVIGFDLASTDFWSLGVFDCEFEESASSMNARFKELAQKHSLTLNPKLYLVSCYA